MQVAHGNGIRTSPAGIFDAAYATPWLAFMTVLVTGRSSGVDMPRIAYLVSSATEIDLADGTRHPTGYFAEEALKPYERFTAAGADVVVVTPDGKAPYADPYGLSNFFHYPDEDQDYFASV